MVREEPVIKRRTGDVAGSLMWRDVRKSRGLNPAAQIEELLLCHSKKMVMQNRHHRRVEMGHEVHTELLVGSRVVQIVRESRVPFGHFRRSPVRQAGKRGLQIGDVSEQSPGDVRLRVQSRMREKAGLGV